MAFLSEEMRAQLMKMVGVNKEELNSMLEQHAPDISKCKDNLVRSSPFDMQLILFQNIIETEGIENVENLPTVLEKLQYVYKVLLQDKDFLDILSLLPDQKKYKNSAESRKLKERGNKEFQTKNFKEAVRYYNQAITLADLNVPGEVSLSIGNRSVVFFQQKDYKSCLHDCQAALMYGYPEDLQYKIHERQGRCYLILRKNIEARSSFSKATEDLEKSKLDENKRKLIRDDIESLLQNTPDTNEEIEDEESLTTKHLQLLNPHSQFPCLNAKVTMKYNDKVGRHGVANEKIRPGEVILKENPITWTLNPDRSLVTCIRCLQPADKHLVPCRTRENGVFCSLACSEDGFEKDTDDRVRDLFSMALETSSTTLLAYWAVRLEPVEFFVKNEQELFTDLKPDFGVNEPEGWSMQSKEEQYRSLYNLVAHRDEMTFDTEIKILITACVLLRLLQEFSYFPSSNMSGDLSREEALVGRLLFQFQCGIKFNQHGLYQADEKVEAGKNLSIFDSGTGVFPTSLFLNHSCSPNTLRINHGKLVYMIAKTEILPGEEVSDCYGIHHLSISKEERQGKLSQSFKFDCVCRACQEDWPLFPDINSTLTPREMGQLGSNLSVYQKEFKAGRFSAASDQCQEYLEKLAKINVQTPHRNYEIAGLALTSCFWGALQE